nr:hypothetical protein [Gammaproteobacteria bacterium]
MTNYRALAVIPAFIGLLAAVTVVYILWQRKQTNGQLSLYRHPHNHHQQQPHQQPHQQQPNRPTQSQQQQHITQHHSTEQDDPSRLVWGLSPEEERTEEERRHLKSPLHQSAILQGTAQGQTGAPTPNHYRHPEIQAAKQQQHKGQKERKEQQEQQQEEEYTPQQQQAAKNIREAIPLTITPNHRQTTRVRKFIFESQSRDLSMYPNPNCYRVQLPRVLRNVIAIALQVAVIPKSEYNVNPYSQWLDIDEGGTIYQVQMPVGTYSLAAAINFPANLQASINAIPALAAYTVTYSNFTRKLTIDSNGAAFTMLFGTGPNRDNSLWQQMGFTRIDTTNAVSHVAPGVIDLNGVTAIDLFADE